MNVSEDGMVIDEGSSLSLPGSISVELQTPAGPASGAVQRKTKKALSSLNYNSHSVNLLPPGTNKKAYQVNLQN